jgi:glyoxylase-like metal-dependent hydrolase (beta-lactamase superfamily II)
MIGRAFLVVAASSFAFPAAAQVAYVHMSGAGREIDVTRIAPNVIQFTVRRDSYVRMLNCTAIITDSDVILFDSLTRPSSAEIVIKKLREITDKPVRIIINSHAHPDHWSGTPAFAKAFPGLDVIASEQTDQFMHRMAPIWAVRIADQVTDKGKSVADEKATGKLPDGTALTAAQLSLDKRDLIDLQSLADEFAHEARVFPTIVYRDHLQMAHGGEPFELTAVTGDQDGTTLAYFPKEKLLLTGDLVSFPIPYVNYRPARQLAALKAIDAMDWSVLMPGHGPAMRDHNFVKLEIAFIEGIIAGVKREIAAGDGDLATIQKRVTLDELRNEFTHGDADLNARYTQRVKDLIEFEDREISQAD